MDKENSQKIIYLGLFPPENPSIGDHAQVLGIQKWFATYFPNMKVEKFYRRYAHSETPFGEGLKNWQGLLKAVGKDDLIFIHSSGDFGTLFVWTKMVNRSWHDFRRVLVSAFPNNKIIQLPVTVYYQGNNTLNKDKTFYRGRQNLVLMCREPVSYKILADNLNCKVLMVPDFAFNLKPALKARTRKGALVALRGDHETRFNPSAKNHILNFVRGMMPVTSRDVNWYASGDSATTRLGNITDKNRHQIVNSVMDQYQNFRVVVTDRLHVMIFSAITKTPCVCISDKIPHKSSGYKPFVGNSIQFVNRIDEIPEAIRQVTSKPPEEVDLTSRFTMLKEKIF